MKLTLWTYEGPPHVGAMRVATGMKGLHYVLHAPQGDTYADLLFTMIERRDHRPPVTYTTFQARDLGIPVIPLDLPSYQRKEGFGTDETFLQIVRHLAKPVARTAQITANLIGPTALGFRHRDDIVEITRLLADMGINVNVCAPMGARPSDIARLGAAHFNVLMYPEHAESAARWLERNFKQPYTKSVPIGVGATHDFLAEVAQITGLPVVSDTSRLRLPWWTRSVDSTYLTGKRVFLFGDGTHVAAAARIARDEMGFEVAGLGCFNREMARPIRALAKEYGVEALITDDYLEVEAAIAALHPEMILGTQMERHIGKRLGIPCAVISAPVHVQDFPARYSPQMGWEGANVIFDTWVHPLVMGLEEHLLHMFRDDFEFHDEAGASHHGGQHIARPVGAEAAPAAAIEAGPIPAEIAPAAEDTLSETASDTNVIWLSDAEKELRKIPFFVRGKARRNTEKFAQGKGLTRISNETLYEAKAHYAR